VVCKKKWSPGNIRGEKAPREEQEAGSARVPLLACPAVLYAQTSGPPNKVDKPPLHIDVDQFDPHPIPHIKARESLDDLSFDWRL
jgi:hypothetical protein